MHPPDKFNDLPAQVFRADNEIAGERKTDDLQRHTAEASQL